MLEPSTLDLVYNPKSDSPIEIQGCFRHPVCARLLILGGGFIHLTCSHYASIIRDDFCGRVHREAEAILERGVKTIQTGIKLDYLKNSELCNQA